MLATARMGSCPGAAAARVVLIRLFAVAVLHVIQSQHAVSQSVWKKQPMLPILHVNNEASYDVIDIDRKEEKKKNECMLT